MKYHGTTYYGVSKTLTTDLPDVTGTWSCKEKYTNRNGVVEYNTYSVALLEDGTATSSEYDNYMSSSWSRTAKTLSIGFVSTTSTSDCGVTLSITFDDPANPISGKGYSSTWAVSNVGGSSENSRELEMFR